jgi:hypothetical protein
MATTSKKTNNITETKTEDLVVEDVLTPEPVVEQVSEPVVEQVSEPVTATFSPETFSTELVMNTNRRATARETGPVRRRRLRHLGYI